MSDEEHSRGPRGGMSDAGGDDHDRRGGRGGGRGGMRGGMRRPRQCAACSEGVKVFDYKLGDALRRFITDRGKIKPRRQTGMCARHQRVLAIQVKRARQLALLPFVSDRAR